MKTQIWDACRKKESEYAKDKSLQIWEAKEGRR